MTVESRCAVLSHERLTPDTYSLWLRPDQPVPVRPGQFLNLSVPGVTLRRPLSVADRREGDLRLVYRIAGTGTRLLRAFRGEALQALLPLGNGFTLPEAGGSLLLLGGGIGCAPLLGLARAATERGIRVTAVFGFRSPEQTLFQQELADLKAQTCFCYDSAGENVVHVLRREGLEEMPFAACGPLAMLRAVDEVMRAPGQFSLEARMGCGFGACMGCAVEMRGGMRRICKDGPVFDRKEILWARLL